MSESTAVAQAPSLLATMAARFGVEPKKMLATLKATAFKGDVTDEQMMALLIVANQYGLNPWTKEIYAFPDKGGIVPVMGVDGWTRIMNSSPEFDGIEFTEGGEGLDAWVECIIYRKDRSRPTKVREYLKECKRNTGPWGSHPRRMLRHKAMIQCARIAFSFGGVYDEEEAQQIIERDVTPITGTVGATAQLRGAVTQEQERGDVIEGNATKTDDSSPERSANDRGPEGNGDAGSGGLPGAGTAVVGSAEGPGDQKGNAPPVRPVAEVVASLRAAKTVADLDDIVGLFDGPRYSESERQQVNQAYHNRAELLNAAPAAPKRTRGAME